MGLLTKEVEIVVNSRNVKYYEDLGYDIPKYYNKNKKKDVYIRGAKFRVNVNDLPVGSNYRVECECEVCKGHSSMSWQTYMECNHDGKTYCKHCASKFFLSGENSPCWKFDKTDEERKNDRSYPEYNIFIKSVLARDNYTCQCCNKSGIELVVHHLDGYNWCKEKRTDVTNGITLCSECHKNYHQKYGKGNNTKEQYMEWMNTSQLELKVYDGKLPTARWAYCVTDDIIIKNIKQYARENNLEHICIYNCCNGKQSTAYNKVYMWYDEYKKLSTDELKIIIWQKTSNKGKPVVCVNYKLLFNNAAQASRYLNLNSGSIGQCCLGRHKSSGESHNGEKLIWRFASDVDNLDEYILVSCEECLQAQKMRECVKTLCD